VDWPVFIGVFGRIPKFDAEPSDEASSSLRSNDVVAESNGSQARYKNYRIGSRSLLKEAPRVASIMSKLPELSVLHGFHHHTSRRSLYIHVYCCTIHVEVVVLQVPEVPKSVLRV